MIIYGSRATRLKTFDAYNTKCSHCGNNTTIRISVFGRYAHIFWVPFVPIGRKVISECQHCMKTMVQPLKNNEFNNESQAEILSAKAPIWNWAGLMIVGGLILFFNIAAATKEKDAREDMFSADLKKMSAVPSMQSDSISFKLKEMMDVSTPDGLESAGFKYFTHIKGDKVMILVQIPGLKKVEKNQRPSVLKIINSVADEQADLNGKQRFIGVKGNVTTMLADTPSGMENSSVVSDEPFYKFYGEKK